MATGSPSEMLPYIAMHCSATPSASSSSKPTLQVSSSLKIVGIVLAIISGVLIEGLLRSQAGHTAGEGVAYLKSVLWWTGMIMMILGEFCNFAAYAFAEALVVTPLGALSVVISAILSSIFLNEKLTFFGWLGCALCIFLAGALTARPGPQEASVGQIVEFQHLFLSPLFVVYASVLILSSLAIIFYFGPKYGSQNMIWHLLVCSLIGGLSVSVTTGLGAAIVTTVMGDNQFKHWFIYFLLIFIAVTLVTEVFYLNKALALFNTGPLQGPKASAGQILTIVMAFLVICVGITILQMSKIDPTEFKSLDRRSTILFQAARKNTEAVEEKSLSAVEEPGIDALRGSFGTVGSIIRARSARHMSQSSATSSRIGAVGHSGPASSSSLAASNFNHYGGMKKHQLFDPPVPRGDGPEHDAISLSSHPSARKTTTIKFGEQDVVHSYHRGTAGKDDMAIHEHRVVPRASSPLASTPVVFAQPRGSPPGNVSGSWSNLQQSPPNVEPPPRFALGVNEPRSAPPAVGLVEHAAYRDPYERGSATATLPSFPSTIALNDDHTSRRQRRQGSSRAYPKGDNLNDDAEERVSLWDPERDSTGEDIDISASPESPYGTVRLVGSSRAGRF
ncbi:magnesium transporter NIPA-domain-containing protein [Russula dissimulans]|nr:magnesium transporter NIPA-domain-containing protein [Russula dissimulans]